MKRFRHLGFALLLALALLVGRQAAALHDLSHATEHFAQGEGSKLPSPKKCDSHFACSQLGSAVGASPLDAPPLVPAAFVPVVPRDRGIARTASTPYQSRAPPASFV